MCEQRKKRLCGELELIISTYPMSQKLRGASDASDWMILLK